MWTVLIAAPAQQSLDRLPARDYARVLNALTRMKTEPLAGDVRKLKGELHGFRRRVGDWRIFFDIETGARRVVITAIHRRTSTTY